MERERALEIVRKHYSPDGVDDTLRRALETLIPELTESEDERIRRELIEEVGYLLPHEEEYDDEGRVLPTYEKRIGRYRAWLEKQKEQKPAECLKAERDGWYVCIKDYYRGGRKRSSVGDLVQAKGGMHIMGEKDISEWFRRAYYEEVRDAFEPNTDTNISEKPAEWSEEDELMILTIIQTLETLGGRGTTGMQIDWLKSLHPQPHWKPSEEELVALKRVGGILRDYGHSELAKTVFMIEGKLAK